MLLLIVAVGWWCLAALMVSGVLLACEWTFNRVRGLR